MPSLLHSHLHLHCARYICFREGLGKGFLYHPRISMKMPIINQILISIECIDLIAKVGCSFLQDHRLKLKEGWAKFYFRFYFKFSIKLQREESILMTLHCVVSLIHRNPKTLHYQHVGITYSVLKQSCLSGVKCGHTNDYSTVQHINHRQGLKIY